MFDDDCEPSTPLCHYCGADCDGSEVETVVVYDDVTAEKPICERCFLAENDKKWAVITAPILKAIRDSERLTAEDMTTRINVTE